MAKYRKKPVVIEAVQYVGSNYAQVQEFLGWPPEGEMGSWFNIETLEGTMTCKINDWIIKGVNNEFYPCKPDIFVKTYEPA